MALEALGVVARGWATDLAPTPRSPIAAMLVRRESRSMLLGRTAVPPATRGMLMVIPVVVVPDGSDVARVGLEEESGDGEDA